MFGNLSATIIVSCVVLFIGAVFLLFVLPIMFRAPTDMWLGDGVFRTELALDNNSRTKGLSGTPTLSPDRALLMVFPSEGKWGIWMKDMNYPIDIVWLDQSKKVIYIVKNASPDDQTTVYQPKTPAKYVVELTGGTVDSRRIKIDSVAIFQIELKEVK